MNTLQFAINLIQKITHNVHLTLTECRTLLLVANGHSTAKEMGEVTNVDKCQYHKACKDLVAKGYLKISKVVMREHYHKLSKSGVEQVKHILSIQ